MHLPVIALPLLLATSSLAHAANEPAKAQVDVCVKAAAATDHIAIAGVDRDACACAVKEIRSRLSPGDFDLHEKMLTVIASGADKKTFDKQMSAIMLKRGMNQQMVDAFLARSKKAQAQAQAKCNTAPPLLGPLLPLKPLQ